jgi:uncharacterized protein YodC (DUF2158 family)
MVDNFEPGDVAQLKSGGPLMTVVKQYDGSGPANGQKVVQCMWWDGSKYENAHLIAALVISAGTVDSGGG